MFRLSSIVLAALVVCGVAESDNPSDHLNHLDGGYQYLTEHYNTLDGGYQWLTDIQEPTTLTDGKLTTVTTQTYTAKNTAYLDLSTITTTVSGSAVTSTQTQYLSWVTVTPKPQAGSVIPPIIAGVVLAPVMFEALQTVADVAAGKTIEEIAASLKSSLSGKKITLTAGDLQQLSKWINAASIAAAAAGYPLVVGPLMKGATIAVDTTTTTTSEEPLITAIMKPPYVNMQELLKLPQPSGEIPDSDEPEAKIQCDRNSVAGIDPMVVNQLATKFCNGSDIDFSKDAKKDLGGESLEKPYSEMIEYATFSYKHADGECEQSCVDSYAALVQRCKYNSHWLTGGANITAGCGTYAIQIVEPPERKTPTITRRPEWQTKCSDSTIFTKFTLKEATKAIKDFCSHDIKLPDLAYPAFKTYRLKDVVIQMNTRWSLSGQENCPDHPTTNVHLTEDECNAGFLQAVNMCNTDTADKKFGSMPATWAGSKGCIDFTIYGNGPDWDCPYASESPPGQCPDSPKGSQVP